MRRVASAFVGTILVISAPEATLGATGAVTNPESSDGQATGRCVDVHRDAKQAYVPDAILVKFADGVGQADFGQVALERSLAEQHRLLGGGWIRYGIGDGRSAIETANELSRDPRVDCAIPIFIGDFDTFPNTPPNDPSYPNQWGLNVIGALATWQIAGGGSSSHFIAIVDTGVDLDHPDLGTVPGRSFVPGQPSFDDICTTVNGMPAGGHGTLVAGIAAAFTNNGKAIAGIAYNAGIRSYRIADYCKHWEVDWAAEAINYAVSQGAWAINFSGARYGPAPVDAEPLHNAVINAWNANVPVVAAAGNDNFTRFDWPTDVYQCAHQVPVTCAVYPALWPEVITVGATMRVTNNFGNVERWHEPNGEGGEIGSNFGLPGLDLSAPGKDIWSTKAGGGTIMASGTSLAAPFVSGIVYLMKSRHPTWTSSQIKARLQTTADEHGPYSYIWNVNYCGPSPYQSAELGCGVLDGDHAVQ